MSAQPSTMRPLPMTTPGVIVAQDPSLTIEAVNDGELLDDANDALAKAVKEAIARRAKAKVTITVTIGPGGKDMPDAMKVTGSVSLSLPKIEGAKIMLPTPDGRITTDLKTVRKTLRPITGGQYEDVKTGEVVDQHGAPIPS